MADCMYCDPQDVRRLELMTPIAPLEASTLHFYREQTYPGRCVLVYHRHVHRLTELEREGLLIGGGTSGRTVTKEEKVLEAMRQQALEDLARECVEKFKVFGITPAQAAEIMLHVKEEEK